VKQTGRDISSLAEVRILYPDREPDEDSADWSVDGKSATLRRELLL
jgi:hypothetical protein